jgi:hypothetical protein
MSNSINEMREFSNQHQENVTETVTNLSTQFADYETVINSELANYKSATDVDIEDLFTVYQQQKSKQEADLVTTRFLIQSQSSA